MESQSPEISNEAREILQLARQTEAMKMNPAWTKIVKDLKEWRDEALETINPAESNARGWTRATICVSSQVGCAVDCQF